MEKASKKRSCLQASAQGEPLSPLCPLQLSEWSGQGGLELHPKAGMAQLTEIQLCSSPPPLQRGSPLLLTKLKHAIGKTGMKERRDIFKFQPNQALKQREVNGNKPPAFCADPASGSSSSAAWGRGAVVRLPRGCHSHRYGLELIFFSHWEASTAPWVPVINGERGAFMHHHFQPVDAGKQHGLTLHIPETLEQAKSKEINWRFLRK